MAEIEASLVSRECLGRDRVGALNELRARVAAWTRAADRQRRKIDWRFSIKDAERVLHLDPNQLDNLVTEH